MLKLEAFFPISGDTVEKDVKIEARSVITSHELERLKDSANLKLCALKSSSAIKDLETVEAEKLINEVNDRFDGEKKLRRWQDASSS